MRLGHTTFVLFPLRETVFVTHGNFSNAFMQCAIARTTDLDDKYLHDAQHITQYLLDPNIGIGIGAWITVVPLLNQLAQHPGTRRKPGQDRKRV